MTSKHQNSEKEPINRSGEYDDTQNEQPGTDNVSDESFEEGDDLSCPSETVVDEYKDKYLRLAAEFDNYRKRTLKEKMDIISTASEDVVKSLLTILDDFDRAAEAMATTTDIESLREGTNLIVQKMRDILKGKGLEEIDAIDKPLDTDYHDAVAQFAAGEEKKGRVVDVAQKGYKLKDKVIRHSKVVVGE